MKSKNKKILLSTLALTTALSVVAAPLATVSCGKEKELQKQLDEANQTINDLKSQIATKEATINDLKSQIANKESQIGALTTEKTNLEAELAKAQKSKETNEAMIGDLKSQIATKEAMIGDLKSQIADKESQIGALTTEKTNLEAQVASYSPSKTKEALYSYLSIYQAATIFAIEDNGGVASYSTLKQKLINGLQKINNDLLSVSIESGNINFDPEAINSEKYKNATQQIIDLLKEVKSQMPIIDAKIQSLKDTYKTANNGFYSVYSIKMSSEYSENLDNFYEDMQENVQTPGLSEDLETPAFKNNVKLLALVQEAIDTKNDSSYEDLIAKLNNLPTAIVDDLASTLNNLKETIDEIAMNPEMQIYQKEVESLKDKSTEIQDVLNSNTSKDFDTAVIFEAEISSVQEFLNDKGKRLELASSILVYKQQKSQVIQEIAKIQNTPFTNQSGFNAYNEIIKGLVQSLKDVEENELNGNGISSSVYLDAAQKLTKAIKLAESQYISVKAKLLYDAEKAKAQAQHDDYTNTDNLRSSLTEVANTLQEAINKADSEIEKAGDTPTPDVYNAQTEALKQAKEKAQTSYETIKQNYNDAIKNLSTAIQKATLIKNDVQKGLDNTDPEIESQSKLVIKTAQDALTDELSNAATLKDAKNPATSVSDLNAEITKLNTAATNADNAYWDNGAYVRYSLKYKELKDFLNNDIQNAQNKNNYDQIIIGLNNVINGFKLDQNQTVDKYKFAYQTIVNTIFTQTQAKIKQDTNLANADLKLKDLITKTENLYNSMHEDEAYATTNKEAYDNAMNAINDIASQNYPTGQTSTTYRSIQTKNASTSHDTFDKISFINDAIQALDTLYQNAKVEHDKVTTQTKTEYKNEFALASTLLESLKANKNALNYASIIADLENVLKSSDNTNGGKITDEDSVTVINTKTQNLKNAEKNAKDSLTQVNSQIDTALNELQNSINEANKTSSTLNGYTEKPEVKQTLDQAIKAAQSIYDSNPTQLINAINEAAQTLDKANQKAKTDGGIYFAKQDYINAIGEAKTFIDGIDKVTYPRIYQQAIATFNTNTNEGTPKTYATAEEYKNATTELRAIEINSTHAIENIKAVKAAIENLRSEITKIDTLISNINGLTLSEDDKSNANTQVSNLEKVKKALENIINSDSQEPNTIIVTEDQMMKISDAQNFYEEKSAPKTE